MSRSYDLAGTTYVVAFGNAFDGTALVGPFPTHDSALAYVEGDDLDWTIVALEPAPAELCPPMTFIEEDA